ncbi:hypothetical protein LCGC14_1338620 [marine sediment metagenome]|uniref:Uncharacterized protein n=1 Tax=marine sediment metagenome TaxID=412755 RepID=A0A0F9MV87_9ZZZZ
MHEFIRLVKSFFRRRRVQSLEHSTFYMDWGAEQIAKIRRNEPIT